LDWTTRAKNIIREVDKLFVVLPEGYVTGPESEILALARGSHIPHTIVYLAPRGDVSNHIEIRAKDTFIPVKVKGAATKEDERIDELPAGAQSSEQHSKRTGSGKKRINFRLATGSNSTSRKSKTKKPVRSAPSNGRKQDTRRKSHIRSIKRLVFNIGKKR